MGDQSLMDHGPDRESSLIIKVAGQAFGLNLALALVKTFLALITNSLAVTAGAIDSGTDAAAFLAAVPLGITTSLAIIAHEVPQELGDLAILLDSGYTRVRAFVFNFLASLTTLLGALTGYFLLEPLFRLIPLFLALSASSFIYIAVADLVPALHRRISFRETVTQTAMILAGIVTIGLFRLWHP